MLASGAMSWGDWYPANELRWLAREHGETVLQQLWVRRHNLESRYEEEWRDVPHG